MVKAYTQILLEEKTRDRFRNMKNKTYSAEVDDYLDLKEKVEKGSKITSEDLDIINGKRFKE